MAYPQLLIDLATAAAKGDESAYAPLHDALCEEGYAWSLRGLARLWEKEPESWNSPKGFVSCMGKYSKDGWLEWVARWRGSKDFE